MELKIENEIANILIKGEIQMKRQNPWILPFLRYIDEHPHANEEDICRNLFCDNGAARKAAVKNILFFFKQQGLITYNNVNGHTLTNDGQEACITGSIWQGMKGAFDITLWYPYGIILNVQPVPEHWYDNGKYGLEDLPEEYGKNLENLILCSNSVKLNSVGKSYRPTHINTDFSAQVNSKRQVYIKANSNVEGMDSYELNFTIDEDIYASIIDG
ncbi:MAG: hypothetical protein MJZ22_02805 [Candidatus Saccharibacteria bacterium]|nr:hypothetical protein [Candidatus Saccharibacteria bacterium]